jgi:deoxycytidylate deaminase
MEFPEAARDAAAARLQCDARKDDQLRTFGWFYRNDLSCDANFMDLASLISRNSCCNGGHMGCVIVRGETAAPAPAASALAGQPPEIIARAINSPLFAANSSDTHAEVNAIAQCARRGVATAGATAYITMPPCRNCFMLLVAAGVARIVSRLTCATDRFAAVAAERGVTLAVVPDDAETEARRAALVTAAITGDGGAERARIVADRLARKEARRDYQTTKQRRRDAAVLAATSGTATGNNPADQASVAAAAAPPAPAPHGAEVAPSVQ